MGSKIINITPVNDTMENKSDDWKVTLEKTIESFEKILTST